MTTVHTEAPTYLGASIYYSIICLSVSDLHGPVKKRNTRTKEFIL